jgi:chlorite dismutase
MNANTEKTNLEDRQAEPGPLDLSEKGRRGSQQKFQTLAADHQRRILAEHGTLAKRYGAGGHAADVRLACHGLDKNDNDFIIGLLGPKLYPLSAIVQEMRKTEQTSQYLDSLGPFFVGRVLWQSPL